MNCKKNTVLMKLPQKTPKCALKLYLETIKVSLVCVLLHSRRRVFSTSVPFMLSTSSISSRLSMPYIGNEPRPENKKGSLFLHLIDWHSGHRKSEYPLPDNWPPDRHKSFFNPLSPIIIKLLAFHCGLWWNSHYILPCYLEMYKHQRCCVF